MRAQDEDTAAQRAHLAVAREELACALDALQATARTVARAARSKRGKINIESVLAAVNDVRRAEETVDLAQLDVATAGGADA